ncbi:MAG: twin-arginine translocase subunit TatC [Bowdeniella nasicola]|nr:twin-arginine translocase subunit TatC [Bowdeniella nasicola]
MAKKNPDGTMPLLAHLKEARNRVLLAVGGVFVCAIAGWFLYDPVLELLTEPLRIVSARDGRIATLNFTTVMSGFDMKMRVSLYLGFFLSSPWWLYQFWAFVAPGLTSKEKRFIGGYVGAAIPLMACGAVLGWYLLPYAIQIMLSFVPQNSASLQEAMAYFTFCLRLLAVFALSFLVPLIMVGVNQLGLVRGHTYLRAWRWALVGTLILAALASPLGDPWSLMLLATPIYLLYLGACGIAILWDRRRDRRVAERNARIDAGLDP